MNRIKTKLLSKNYQKAFTRLATLAVIFTFISIGTCLGIFSGRLKNMSDVMEQQEKVQQDRSLNENQTDSGYYQEEKGHVEDKYDVHHDMKKMTKEQIKTIMNLSKGEKILIGVFVVVGILLVIWYWLLVIGVTIKTASKLGINQRLFGGLACFINIGALIILYIYKRLCKICESCGKVQSRKATYCSNCGKQF